MDSLVSFVVPCYKLAHLLPQCVNSILAQTYKNFEILIIDNCSPDNTPEVAASFNDPRVKHIRNETNLGHIRNFNKGITMARGKYVWLISPDDWLNGSNALAHYVDTMERNPGAGFAFCRAIEVQGSREIGVAQWTSCGNKDRIWDGPSFLMRLIEGDCIVLSSVMVRKECYEKYGMELAGVISDRRDFNTAIASLAARAMRYGLPGGSKRPGLRESDIEEIARNHVKDSQDAKDFRARLHMAIGDEEFWHGQYKLAAQAYWLGLKLRPWWMRGWVKYLLLRTGGVGLYVRRSILGLRESREAAR